MISACSHLVLATEDVPRIMGFFKSAFQLKPHFENDMFGEFVLPSGFRLAFFKPVGASARTFSAAGTRNAVSFGLTVKDVDEAFVILEKTGATLSGKPKEHPWGEKSFLLTDPDGNRWEITQSPSATGMLVNR